MNKDLLMLDNQSLVKKVYHLCHIRGEKQALAQEIPLDLDTDIAIGTNEILVRLERVKLGNINLIPSCPKLY